jgi:acetyl esterase/lipase
MRINEVMDPIVYRGMTRSQLDAAYNNGAAVRNSEQKLAEYTERGKATRARPGARLNLAYGPRPRNKIDIVPCGQSGAPLFAFIHGGYWQRNSKETFACMAEGPLAHGFDAALIGYTLAPDASLTEIVGEVRAAVRWLRAKGPALGLACDKFILCGWSAGAHLTAMILADAEADAGLAISGLYELEPCRLNYVNDKLKLTPDEQLALSPIRHLPASSPPLTVAFGTGELPEMQRQSRDYAAARREAKLPTQELPLAGHDHYSILEELADPDGVLARCLAEMAK